MKRKRFTEEQIAYALRQEEGGTSVAEICRKIQQCVSFREEQSTLTEDARRLGREFTQNI